MAEDPHFASRPESKRKYEDQLSSPPPPPARRATGFSAPIASLSPDSKINNAVTGSYNTVPPPADEIQIAKQRAQEIAARLFNIAEANRPRTEGGSTEEDFTKKPYGQQTFNSQLNVIPPTSLPGTYGFSGNTKKIDIPNGKVGVIIGKAGETIKYLQLQSGAKIQVTRDMDADPTSQTRPVELMGTAEQISKAEQLINEAIAEAEAGSGTTRRFNSGQMGSEQFVMEVPNNKVGLIIGKGGETIKNMQSRSGARIQLIPLHLPPGDTSTERTVQIDGTSEQIESAKQLISEVVSENRVRNPPMGGGYPQQGYRPPRPPTNWGPPGPPMQQAGYGYMQPGTYPGQPPQYNASQPPYGGLPPQPVTAGQPSGWDQSLTPPSQQSSGYDYYNQQSAQQQQPTSAGSAVADNSSYNYGQPPASNYNSQGSYAATTNYSQPQVGQQQGYVQDGYGGYHTTTPQPSYSQPQSNSQPGYNQPEGYSNAQGYQAMTNTNQDPGAPSYGVQGGPIQVPSSQQVPQPVQPPAASQQGGYASQPPATTTASYVSQGTPTQPGYGVPPTSQPSYGSQSSDQTGYPQPTPLTPSYGQPQGQQQPPTQPVYRQSPQQAPTTQGGYAASAQPGYSHSQPPTAQSGYGQQDPGLNHGQPSSYGSAAPQPGYGQQHIYGAPQPGYGQAYNDSYGSSVGGYSQLPAYSSDNGAGGNAHGAYDVTPSGGAQPVQSGVAKASPQT